MEARMPEIITIEDLWAWVTKRRAELGMTDSDDLA
jgi:hypothetical protein